MGDFNHDLLNLSIRDFVFNFWNSFDLHVNHNQFAPTHFTKTSSTLLDYFVYSSTSNVKFSSQMHIPGISHHSLIFISLDLVINESKKDFYYRDFKSLDLSKALEDAQQLNLDSIYDTNDTELQITIFNTEYIKLLNKHVPLKLARKRKQICAWHNKHIANFIVLRDLAYKA